MAIYRKLVMRANHDETRGNGEVIARAGEEWEYELQYRSYTELIAHIYTICERTGSTPLYVSRSKESRTSALPIYIDDFVECIKWFNPTVRGYRAAREILASKEARSMPLLPDWPESQRAACAKYWKEHPQMLARLRGESDHA